MTTITSTFIGIAFPHAIEFAINEDTNEEYCYMQLYEVYRGKFSVKVIVDKDTLMKALNDYKPGYTQENMEHQKQPLMISVTGCMKQVRLDFDYHGRVAIEKFHVEPFVVAVIPCNPFIAEPLKELVHPQTAPQRFSGDANALFDYVVILNMEHEGPVTEVEIVRDREEEGILAEEVDEENRDDVNFARPTQYNDDDDEIPDVNPRDRNRSRNNVEEENEEDLDDFIDGLFVGRVNSGAFEAERNPTSAVPISDPEPNPAEGTLPFFFSRQSSVTRSMLYNHENERRSSSVITDMFSNYGNERRLSSSVNREVTPMDTVVTPRSERFGTPMTDETTALPNLSQRYSTRVADEIEEPDLSSSPVYVDRNEAQIEDSERRAPISSFISLQNQQAESSSSSNSTAFTTSAPTSSSLAQNEQFSLKRKISFMDIDENEDENERIIRTSTSSPAPRRGGVIINDGRKRRSQKKNQGGPMDQFLSKLDFQQQRRDKGKGKQREENTQ